VLLSGGIDSATALYLTKKTRPVRSLSFEFSGIAERELESARVIAGLAEVVEHRVVRLPDLKEAGDIPGFMLAGRPPSYIPLRNSVFYSLAASFAEEIGADAIVGGHNKDDERVFSDVSPQFFAPLQTALRAASPMLRRNRLRIVRPLRSLTKPQVIKLGVSLGVPLELTWSCHRDAREHCWKCDGCLSRKRAFKAAGVSDPLRSNL
jgi:7-cyano-7-deazaguanine synthase